MIADVNHFCKIIVMIIIYMCPASRMIPIFTEKAGKVGALCIEVLFLTQQQFTLYRGGKVKTAGGEEAAELGEA
jgi:hypothetical protein